MAAKKTRVVVTIDPGILKRLTKAAEGLGVSRSALVEKVVRDFLEEGDQMLRAFGDPVVRSAFVSAFSQPGVLASMAEAMRTELDKEKVAGVLEFFKQVDDAAGAKTPAQKGKRRR